MHKYSSQIIAEVKKYRKLGYSIHELMEKFSMPKTSVWYHIQGVKIHPKHKKMLMAKRGGSMQRSQAEWKKASEEAQTILKNTNVTQAMPVVLAALYWGEGNKNNSFVFSNTDEEMIKVFIKVLKEYFKIKEQAITALIRITNKHNDRLCLEYWQKVTNLPKQNIRINYNNKQNKGRMQYGLCRIRVKKGGYMLKLTHCLIRELTIKIKKV